MLLTPRMQAAVALGRVLAAAPALACALAPVAALLLWPAPAAAPAPATALAPPSVKVVQTTANLAQALTRLPDLPFGGPPPAGVPVIHVNDRISYQRVAGFGAAMTDTSAWLIHDELGSTDAAALMGAMFGPGGIHLNFIRVPMGASDFTAMRQPYTYDDVPTGQKDPDLKRFSIAHDDAYILPVLRQALALNPHTTILASPWSAPAWMKRNHSLDNYREDGSLLRSAYPALAKYFVKFIQAYTRSGIPITAVTPQNEPGHLTSYPGMRMSEPAEDNWVVNYLVPALASAHLGTEIYGYDYGWSSGSMPFAKALISSSAASALTGLATHCYFGSPTAMDTLHQLAPWLDEIVSECSPGITPFPTAELLIGSMRNWASTVALWNYALDPTGGPVQPPNSGCPGCRGLVTIGEATHTVTLRQDYYQMGQMSSFVRPGAVRVASENFVSYRYPGRGRNIATPGLDDVAFVNPDGSEVLVAFNNGASPVTFAVDSASRYFTDTLAPGTTATFVWKRPG